MMILKTEIYNKKIHLSNVNWVEWDSTIIINNNSVV